MVIIALLTRQNLEKPTRDKIMKISQAKKLINEAASAKQGFNVVFEPSQALILGVKLGKITAEKAAEKTILDYANSCTTLFQGQ